MASQLMEIQQALIHAKNKGVIRTHATMINWCMKYGIGHKVGGAWMVSREKLDALINGGAPKEENTDG